MGNIWKKFQFSQKAIDDIELYEYQQVVSISESSSNAEVDYLMLLNDDCWEHVISYLDVVSQLDFARSDDRICRIFRNYARRHYRHIDGEITQILNDEELEQLLQIIGDLVLSYATPECITCTYRSHNYDRILGRWHNSWVHEHTRIRNLYKRHFEIVVKYCPYLECFSYSERNLHEFISYELILKLPRLKHLALVFKPPMRSSFLNMLSRSPSLPLESLILHKSKLFTDQLIDICKIETLRELYVFMDESCKIQKVISHFMRLQRLEYLHICISSINDSQTMQLINALPSLKYLYINCYTFIGYYIMDELEIAQPIPNLMVHVQTSESQLELLNDPERGIFFFHTFQLLFDEPQLFKIDLNCYSCRSIFNINSSINNVNTDVFR